jgi:predicted permease
LPPFLALLVGIALGLPGAIPSLYWARGSLSGVPGRVLVVGVVQAAMPPMVSAALLADQYAFGPALARAV